MTNDNDLPETSEVTGQLPEGHVAAREQQGAPQSLQGLSDTLGNQFPVVISTGRTHSDEILMEAMLAAEPPQPWVPAQDPTPLKAGDKVPVDPSTGELSFQGGPSRVVSPVLSAREGGVQEGEIAGDLTEVQGPINEDPVATAVEAAEERTVHGGPEAGTPEATAQTETPVPPQPATPPAPGRTRTK